MRWCPPALLFRNTWDNSIKRGYCIFCGIGSAPWRRCELGFRVSNLGFSASRIYCSGVGTPVTIVEDLAGRILVFAKNVMVHSLGGAVN